MNSFQETNFYVAIGICPTNGTCCVFVDTVPPTAILQPQSDRRYVVHTLFSFRAPKRVVMSTVITTLTRCQITPGSFCPPVNPDNKFYTGLPKNKRGLVIEVVRHSIEGLCVGLVDNKPASIYTETITPPSVFKENMASALPNLALDLDRAHILGEECTTFHTFPE